MDLRPKIAREIANDIAAYLREHQGLFVSNDQLDLWVLMILKRMVPHSIEFPKREHVSTTDSRVVQQFRDKYPALEQLIALTQAEALKRWPGPTFVFEVVSDPESSHVCSEGQHLVMKINTQLAYTTYMLMCRLTEDSWRDFTCREGPYQDLVLELGEVAHLFRTDLDWTT